MLEPLAIELTPTQLKVYGELTAKDTRTAALLGHIKHQANTIALLRAAIEDGTDYAYCTLFRCPKVGAVVFHIRASGDGGDGIEGLDRPLTGDYCVAVCADHVALYMGDDAPDEREWDWYVDLDPVAARAAEEGTDG